MGEKQLNNNNAGLREYVNNFSEGMSLGEKIAFLIRNNTVMVINEKALAGNQPEADREPNRSAEKKGISINNGCTDTGSVPLSSPNSVPFLIGK